MEDKVKIVHLTNKETEREIFLINPTDNWRKAEAIKNGELKEELLTFEQVLERYELTELQIQELKNTMKK